MLIETISEAIVAVGCGPIDRVRIVIHELAGSIQSGGPAPIAMNNGNRLPILNMYMMEGRSSQVKETLSDKLATTLVDAGYALDTVQVSIQEVPSSSWGIGGKTARDLGR
jgi:4-oxalocrotonate tautomerase